MGKLPGSRASCRKTPWGSVSPADFTDSECQKTNTCAPLRALETSTICFLILLLSISLAPDHKDHEVWPWGMSTSSWHLNLPSNRIILVCGWGLRATCSFQHNVSKNDCWVEQEKTWQELLRNLVEMDAGPWEVARVLVFLLMWKGTSQVIVTFPNRLHNNGGSVWWLSKQFQKKYMSHSPTLIPL